MIFEKKTRWSLEEAEGEAERENQNYLSAKGLEDKILTLFREEQALGWMQEVSLDDAKRIYGDRLHIASLGVVQEPEKIRVVHDGSHGVHVNHRIRTQDQLRMPTAGEIRTFLA